VPVPRVARFAITVLVACTFGAAAGAAQQRIRLTDPQIAELAYTAALLDIENAKLAIEKAHGPAIHRFAEGVIREDRAVDKKMLALVRRLGIVREDSALSRALVEQSNTARGQLSGLSGRAFEEAYLSNEIAYHQTVESALRLRGTAVSRNLQLKRLLAADIKLFAAQERRAAVIARKAD
jgi:putative membrane protein